MKPLVGRSARKLNRHSRFLLSPRVVLGFPPHYLWRFSGCLVIGPGLNSALISFAALVGSRDFRRQCLQVPGTKQNYSGWKGRSGGGCLRQKLVVTGSLELSPTQSQHAPLIVKQQQQAAEIWCQCCSYHVS